MLVVRRRSILGAANAVKSAAFAPLFRMGLMTDNEEDCIRSNEEDCIRSADTV
jgi:hypothetical protein